METKTLTIVKPLHFSIANDILLFIEVHGFKIVDKKVLYLSEKMAAEFYQEHEGRDFFTDIIKNMSCGPVVVAILAKESTEEETAVEAFRKLLGATDPAKADKGTIRNIFGVDKSHNAAHGSDSDKSAQREIEFFFPEYIV